MEAYSTAAGSGCTGLDACSIQFYRLLGLDLPETPDEGHIETFLANGTRFMLDSEDVVRSFRPGWERKVGS